jgi:flavin-dependent dehydrogenase
MPSKTQYDVVIVGGGLAGLVAAIELSKAGKYVLVIEKKTYPFHKVCGEYVSNEVLQYLTSLGFNPHNYGASTITQLRVSTPAGKSYTTPLQLGGFGISRYVMDNALFEFADKNGAEIITNTRVTDIQFDKTQFRITTNTNEVFTSKFVIASHGKRDILDKKLERSFIDTHTGYLGVKYHVKTEYPKNEIGLDNFDGGYCGITRIEDETYNLCYLYNRNKNAPFKSIQELEETVLYKNPVLKNIFSNADFVFDKPEVINEICFDKKELVLNHIFMCGDSAGLITPLCGNGMSMAIAGARLLSQHLISSSLLNKEAVTISERIILEKKYANAWNTSFGRRLYWGRSIQSLFGNPTYTGAFIKAAYHSPFRDWLIRQTHGKVMAL